MSCLGNDWIGEWPVNIFFPELGIKKLSAFKYYQKPNGQVPSTLGSGTEPDKPWYNQQFSLDGQYYVQMVDRYWQVVGDDSALEEYYPSVKASMHFMMTVDEDGDWLPDVKSGYKGFTSSQYYDGWKRMTGAAIHVSGYWLSTLRMAERMAVKMGDEVFAEECRSWVTRASRSVEEKLWNPQVGSYLLYHQPETGKRVDTILSDQLVGEFLARVHGLDGVFPEARVKTVLETIWNLNVASTPYGVRVTIRPDGSTNSGPGLYGAYHQVIIVSYSSIVPSGIMVYTGNRECGLEMLRRIWRRVVCDVKMPWDQIWGLVADSGGHAGGIEYYHNSMLWAFPAAVLGEDLKTFCAPSGLVGRIIRAAKEESPSFNSPSSD